MGILGACIGAVLGGTRGGFLGGLLGSLAGDWVENQIRGRKNGAAALGNERELSLLAALSAMLAKLAKADGHISIDEVHYCEGVFTRLGLKGEKRAYCVRVFQTAKNDAHTIYDYAASFAAAQTDDATRSVVYDILWDLACVDGVVSSGEQEILRNILPYLRLDGGFYAWQCHRRGLGGAGDASRSDTDPYVELGVARTASDDEVRTAYREKAKRLHPDLLRAQGLSEELLGRANEQMARINAAWDRIKRERGL